MPIHPEVVDCFGSSRPLLWVCKAATGLPDRWCKQEHTRSCGYITGHRIFFPAMAVFDMERSVPVRLIDGCRKIGQE